MSSITDKLTAALAACLDEGAVKSTTVDRGEVTLVVDVSTGATYDKGATGFGVRLLDQYVADVLER